MQGQRSGHILNIGSAAGFSSFPEMGSYNLVKAAVISLSETLRVELAPSLVVSMLAKAYAQEGSIIGVLKRLYRK